MGELGLFYRLAGIVLVGKSLASAGGQNPIEPAKLASAILHGPHVANFADVYALLDAGGGAALTRDADELAAALLALFADAGRLRAMARAAASAVEREAGAVERAMARAGAASGRAAGLAPVIAPRFWADRASGLDRPGALSPLGAIYGAATARRMARRGDRRLRRPSCASAISSSAAPARRRPRSRSRGCCRTPASASPSCRAAMAAPGAPSRCASIPRCTARATSATSPCCSRASRPVSSAPTGSLRPRAAIEAGASVLVMDDGLQNPALVKDLSLAVVDGEARFGNGLCVPAGPLRAPLEAQAQFVDALVVIGGEIDSLGDLCDAAPGKPVFRARLQPDAVVAARLIGRPVLAFAGIARPEKFFATLSEIGASVAATRVFPDHHPFTSTEIEALLARSRRRATSSSSRPKRTTSGSRRSMRAQSSHCR